MIIVKESNISTIRGQVARILFVSALLFSLLFGGSLLVYESWKAINRFEAIAIHAISALTTRLEDPRQFPTQTVDDATIAGILAERYQVSGGHFVAIQIADPMGRILASATMRGYLLLPEIGPHAPPYGEVFFRGGELYVLVVRGITEVGKTSPIWLQGVFHIATETKNDVIGAVIKVVTFTCLTVLLTTLLLYPIIVRLHSQLAARSQELLHSYIEMLQALGSAISKRDSDTYTHNFRVTFYAVKLAQAAKRPSSEIGSLIKGAFLHDLGKIAISDTILLKPGKLDTDEMAIMKTHVNHGLEMIGNVGWLADAVEVVECHHERWNGTGYPKGLKGEAIPINARIFAIADVFDALTSRRPYKPPFSLEQTLELMLSERGRHFDPNLLDVFQSLLPDLTTTVGNEKEMPKIVFQLADMYLKV